MQLMSHLLPLILLCVICFTLPSHGQKKVAKKTLNPKRIIATFDLNKDGKLDEEEFSQSKRAASLSPEAQTLLFKQLDKDQDNFISLKELKKAFWKNRRVSSELIESLDENHDGIITRVEFDLGRRFKKLPPEARDRVFKRLDQNKDGQLTEADQPKKKRKVGIYFDTMDINDDGQLTPIEFSQTEQAKRLLKARFDWLDWNKDGMLDEAELYRKDDWPAFSGNPKDEEVIPKKVVEPEPKKEESSEGE